MKCLLLASGFGTRLYPVTRKTAKGLLPYKGKPVISYIVEGIPRDIEIYVTTNRKFASQYRGWQKTLDREVALFIEPVVSEEQRLGAVGSLEYWVETNAVDDDLLVIASDNYFDFDSRDFISHFDGRRTLVAVYDIKNMEDACQFGVITLEGDRVVKLIEKPPAPQSSLVSTACYIFPARVLSLLHDFCNLERKDNLGNFIAHLIRYDEVQAYVFSGAWFDIGNVWPRLNGNRSNQGC